MVTNLWASERGFGRIGIAAGAALLLTALAGCASGPGEATAQSAPPSPSTVSVSDTPPSQPPSSNMEVAGDRGGSISSSSPSPTPAADVPLSGLIVSSDCNSYTLDTITGALGEPHSMKVAEVDSGVILINTMCRNNSNLGPNLLDGDLFASSPDMNFTAAVKPFDDGSQHVGVVDVASGGFTDITGDLHSEGGFSGSAVKDLVYGFAADGTLYLDHDGTTLEAQGPPYVRAVPAQIPLTQIAGHRWMGSGLGYMTELSEVNYQRPPDSAPVNSADSANDDSIKAQFAEVFQSSVPSSVAGCTPVGWLDATTWLCSDSTSQAIGNAEYVACETIDVVGFCGEGFRWVVPEARVKLLPEAPEQHINVPIASPTGKEFVFESTKSNRSSIYIQTVGGGEPRKLLDVADTDGKLKEGDIRFSWR